MLDLCHHGEAGPFLLELCVKQQLYDRLVREAHILCQAPYTGPKFPSVMHGVNFHCYI